MSTPANVKVLTVGSAAGAIRELFAKIKAIDAKHGKFDLVLCIGDFFGPLKEDGQEYGEEEDLMQLLNGTLDAPVECYIMQGEHPLPQPVIEKFAKTGRQISKNVFLLHKSGVMATANGIRIGCLGGIYDEKIYAASDSAHGFTSPYFTSVTVDKLLVNTMTKSDAPSTAKNASYGSLAAIKSSTATTQLVDILLTNVFPANANAFSAVPPPSPNFPPLQAEPVAEIVRRIKPRYHFVAGGGSSETPMFWEREPFVWADEGDRATRLVSLGAFGAAAPAGGKKQRWFYAFSIAPHIASAPPAARPANATQNPFTEYRRPQGMKRPLQADAGLDYRWGNVPQAKRTRVGPAGEEGKPPPGYKCKICESPDHFINDCPDRAKPQEGYICKICKEPGHFVRDCPTKHQVGDTGGRKPREGYVCRACGSELHYIEDCPTAQAGPRQRRAPQKEIAPDVCWFCLSNPNLAKHLIVSIGTECYVSLPKGQIIPTHSAGEHQHGKIPSVPGGGHVLIIPITHNPTYATIPADLAGPIIEETEKYKTALKAFFAKHDAHPVFFEVGRLSAKGGHAHIQVVPVPRSISADEIAAAFTDEGSRLGVDLEFADVTAETGPGDRGYFKAELPDGRKLVHWLKDRTPFSIQFGRQVLVSLLGMPERFDWKECAQSEEEEKADAEEFKTAFIAFDPSLQ